MSCVITNKNFGDIAQAIKRVKKQAEESEDKFHRYSSESFFIVGQSMFEWFIKEFNFQGRASAWGSQQQLTNKSTIAEVKHVYFLSYHYDAETSNEYWDGATFFQGILVDGEILRATFYRNSKTASLSLLNDPRRYHERLPYQWEENHRHPNDVSVLTDKKVKDWLNWLRQRRDAYDNNVESENKAIDLFLEKVREVAKVCSESNIGATKGRLFANGIIFSYDISNGYISQRLELSYRVNHNLDGFLKLIGKG